MTSPFVDRVEYQVIGRDTNASRVFRDVADAADAAGDSIGGLGSDLDRVNRSIDDTADRMRALLSSLQDLSATREITITTNVREVLGSIEDNRQVLDLLDDRFENLTVNVTATVNQLVELNDGLTTVDDNRTGVITLGDDVRALTQNITATVDSVVDLNDGLQTINDNRNVVIDLGDDVRALTQNITATVDSVVDLNDGLQTVNDNRTAVIELGDDVRQLTQNITATVDSVVDLNDGLQTVNDNRTAVIDLGDDVRQLTQNITATVDSVVDLNDGLQTVNDNRTVIINLGDDVRQLTQNITATVDSVVDLNDGLQTVNDNRTVIIDLGDDVRQLTQNITATVDSVVDLNDGLTTTNDNRNVIINLGDDVRQLTQNVDATVDSVVRLNDGIQTIDDNRAAVVTLDDDFRTLTQSVDATVDSVVRLNDGIQTIDDNRAAVITVGDDFRQLTQNVDATVDSVVELRDGIQTVDDNRNAIVTVDDDFRTLTQNVDATVRSVVELRDGIQTVDDNRSAITGVGDDFRNLRDDIDNTRTVVIRFNDEVARVDDNRAGVVDLGTGFDDLGRAVERSRDRVTDLDRDIRNLPGNDDIDLSRRVVETISSDRDRWERAGLIGGAALAHGALTAIGLAFASGLSNIPFVGGMLASVVAGITAVAPEVTLALAAVTVAAAGAAGVVAVNAFTAAFLLGLGGGVLVAGVLASINNAKFKDAFKGIGTSIKDLFKNAVAKSGFTTALITALQAAKSHIETLKPAMETTFRNAVPLIQPLIDAFIGFTANVLPGVAAALRNMKPIFDALAEKAPKLGKAIGDFFEKISEQSPNAAEAFGAVLDFVSTGIDLFGDFLVAVADLEPYAENFLRIWGFIGKLNFMALIGGLELLAVALQWVVDAGDWLWKQIQNLTDAFTGLEGPVGRVAGAISRALGPFGGIAALALGAGGALGVFGGKADDAGSKASGLGGALGSAGAAAAVMGAKAATAATDAEKLAEGIDKAMDAANDFINLGDSQLAMYEAMEAATKRVATASGKDLKAGIDLSTAAGKVNWQTLAAIARNANRAAQDVLDLNGTQEDAAAVTQIARQKFMKTAAAFGITGQAAVDLANQMFGIPDVVKPDVSMDVSQALGAVTKIKKAIKSITGKTVYINVVLRDTGPKRDQGERIPGVGLIPKWASGGAVGGPGPKGVDSKLALVAPGEHILTAAEVDAAGGHAEIMEFRRSLLNKAHAPRATAAQEVGVHRSHGGQGIDARTLRRALEGMTLVIDDRSGRTAQLIARGG